MTNLAAALVKAQAEFPHIPLDATNPHFKNKFASLGAILPRVLPVLHKNGIALIQHPTVSEGKPALRTVLLHESGEREEDTMLLVLDKENSQGQGSALTYAKRQAVTAVLGLVADEDDDGEAASRPKVSRAKNKPVVKPANDPPASQAQKNRIFAIVGELAKQREVDPVQVRGALKAALGIESMSQLTVAGATKADALLAAWQKKVGATA